MVIERDEKERIVKLIILSEELGFSLVTDLLIDFLIQKPEENSNNMRNF